jgi:hypothetical protein
MKSSTEITHTSSMTPYFEFNFFFVLNAFEERIGARRFFVPPEGFGILKLNEKNIYPG